MGYSLQSVAGSAYYSLILQHHATVASSPVILQEGTVGTSTIYTNNTSAMVSVGALNWLSDWDKRVKITLDHNDVDSALSDFPVLVCLNNFSSGRNSEDVSFVFDELQSDSNRKKIAFTTSDGTTQCYVEIERWDSANEQAWVWVKAPSINNVSDTELYLYYDMDHVDNIDYVGDPNSTAAEKVWGSSFRAVHHMEEDPAGNITDSTNNQYDMNAVGGMSSSNLVDANIGKGVSFDGGDDAYTGQGSITLTQFTFSGWINGSSFSSWRTIATVGEQRDLCLNTGVLTLWADDTEYDFGSSLPTGAWHHVAVTYDGTTLRGYINGSDTGDSYTPGLSSYTGTLQIARSLASYDYFNGVLDEIRISNQSRSAAWLKASYESGRDDFLDLGTEETATYDYVLRVNNTVTDSWQIRFKEYSNSSVGRLQNCTIYFHNSTDGNSPQIVVENGSFKNGTGSWYNLGSSQTIYIAITVEASSTGTSYIYTYLEVRTPNTTTYAQYTITLKIT
jgi:hypothetical protein